jgi:hypothetical protein
MVRRFYRVYFLENDLQCFWAKRGSHFDYGLYKILDFRDIFYAKFRKINLFDEVALQRDNDGPWIEYVFWDSGECNI